MSLSLLLLTLIGSLKLRRPAATSSPSVSTSVLVYAISRLSDSLTKCISKCPGVLLWQRVFQLLYHCLGDDIAQCVANCPTSAFDSKSASVLNTVPASTSRRLSPSLSASAPVCRGNDKRLGLCILESDCRILGLHFLLSRKCLAFMSPSVSPGFLTTLSPNASASVSTSVLILT